MRKNDTKIARTEPAEGAWRKSRYSNPSGNCVEVMTRTGHRAA